MPETEAEHAAESTRCCFKRLRKATGCSAKKTGHGHGHGHEQTPERQSLLGSHRQRRWIHEAMTNDTEPDRGDRARLMRPSPTEEGGIGTYRVASRDSVQVTTPCAVSRTPVPGSAPIALCHETPSTSPPIALYYDPPFQDRHLSRCIRSLRSSHHLSRCITRFRSPGKSE